MRPNMYMTMYPTSYISTPYPCAADAVPSNAIVAARKKLRENHRETHHIYDNKKSNNSTLNAQVIDTVDETYFVKNM